MSDEERPIDVCEYDNADECALARERSVAGISNDIPACPVHGEFPDVLGVPVTELLGVKGKGEA